MYNRNSRYIYWTYCQNVDSIDGYEDLRRINNRFPDALDEEKGQIFGYGPRSTCFLAQEGKAKYVIKMIRPTDKLKEPYMIDEMNNCYMLNKYASLCLLPIKSFSCTKHSITQKITKLWYVMPHMDASLENFCTVWQKQNPAGTINFQAILELVKLVIDCFEHFTMELVHGNIKPTNIFVQFISNDSFKPIIGDYWSSIQKEDSSYWQSDILYRASDFSKLHEKDIHQLGLTLNQFLESIINHGLANPIEQDFYTQLKFYVTKTLILQQTLQFNQNNMILIRLNYLNSKFEHSDDQDVDGDDKNNDVDSQDENIEFYWQFDQITEKHVKKPRSPEQVKNLKFQRWNQQLVEEAQKLKRKEEEEKVLQGSKNMEFSFEKHKKPNFNIRISPSLKGRSKYHFKQENCNQIKNQLPLKFLRVLLETEIQGKFVRKSIKKQLLRRPLWQKKDDEEEEIDFMKSQMSEILRAKQMEFQIEHMINNREIEQSKLLQQLYYHSRKQDSYAFQSGFDKEKHVYLTIDNTLKPLSSSNKQPSQSEFQALKEEKDQNIEDQDKEDDQAEITNGIKFQDLQELSGSDFFGETELEYPEYQQDPEDPIVAKKISSKQEPNEETAQLFKFYSGMTSEEILLGFQDILLSFERAKKQEDVFESVITDDNFYQWVFPNFYQNSDAPILTIDDVELIRKNQNDAGRNVLRLARAILQLFGITLDQNQEKFKRTDDYLIRYQNFFNQFAQESQFKLTRFFIFMILVGFRPLVLQVLAFIQSEIFEPSIELEDGSKFAPLQHLQTLNTFNQQWDIFTADPQLNMGKFKALLDFLGVSNENAWIVLQENQLWVNKDF